MNNKTKKNVTKTVISAAMLAMCIVLPFLTGNIKGAGMMFCPIHIPVLLCGFICGPIYGIAVGFSAPILRSVTVGMPRLFPDAFAMMFELAAYGFFTGLFYKLFPKKIPYIYLSLVLSMLIGRIISGIVKLCIFGLESEKFGWAVFLTDSFVTAIPGIILQIVFIPAIIIALKKAKLIYNE